MPDNLLVKLLDQFSKTKILILGDVMLDRYWWGDVTRISPEAPVPVVRLLKDTYVPGGAANVAVNVAGLGAEAILIGLTGNDVESDCLRSSLENAGVSASRLAECTERPTNVKTRVVAHNQQVVRVDRELTAPLSHHESGAILNLVSANLESSDAVLVSDYAKGTLTDDILSHVFSLAQKAGKSVIVDPKGRDYGKYSGAKILTPNRKEAAEACNLDLELPDVVSRAGISLLDELDLDGILITQSEHGMTLFERGKPSKHYEAVAKEVYDVTGAGDTVLAVLGVAVAAGADVCEAARLANIAAGVVVQQVGTAAIEFDKLSSLVLDPETENFANV